MLPAAEIAIKTFSPAEMGSAIFSGVAPPLQYARMFLSTALAEGAVNKAEVALGSELTTARTVAAPIAPTLVRMQSFSTVQVC